MTSDSSAARKSERKRRARAHVDRYFHWSQRVVDRWHDILSDQIAAAAELCDESVENGGDLTSLASDVCSTWLGAWVDGLDLMYEACDACHSTKSTTEHVVHKAPHGGAAPEIAFTIGTEAEAAEPKSVPGVKLAEIPTVVLVPLDRMNSKTPGSIPVPEIRVSSYNSGVLLSLVQLGGQVAAGRYIGPLQLTNGNLVANVTVTVT